MVDKISAVPVTTREDFEQESILQGLEGKKRKVFSRKVLEIVNLTYGLIAPEDAEPLGPTPPTPNVEAIEQLSTWMLQQSERLRHAILDYLDDPRDRQIIRILTMLNLKFHPIEMREITLTQLMLDSLPTNMESLYELARREHKSKRPHAAVRVILRSLLRKGEVVLDGTTYKKTKKEGARRSLRKRQAGYQRSQKISGDGTRRGSSSPIGKKLSRVREARQRGKENNTPSTTKKERRKSPS